MPEAAHAAAKIFAHRTSELFMNLKDIDFTQPFKLQQNVQIHRIAL